MNNIGIIGEVSVGKSTLVNALISKYLSPTSLKRTTFVPFLFKNSKEEDNYETIQETILDANKNKEQYKTPIEFNTQFSFSANKYVNLIDFAGVNDGAEIDYKMKNVFFNYIDNLNYIIYISDSNSSMTLKSERDFFIKLASKIKKSQNNGNIICPIVVFNKYDNIFESEDNEIDEIINDAIVFMKKYINFNFFKVSAQKMMVKNIMKKDKKELHNLSSNIVFKILSEYHGKRKAKDIMESKKIEYEDIEYIDFTQEETNLLKYLNSISNEKNYIQNIKEIIERNIIDVTYYDTDYDFHGDCIFTRIQKYKKYLDIQEISDLFTSTYLKLLNKESSFGYEDFVALNRFIELNKKTKLNKEEMAKQMFKKHEIYYKDDDDDDDDDDYDVYDHYDPEYTGYEMFMLFLRYNFKDCLYWKDIDGNKLVDNISEIINYANKTNNFHNILNNLDKIKSLHTDIIQIISNSIDKYIIEKVLLKYKYKIEHVLSLNKHLYTSLCCYLNTIDEDKFEEVSKALYTNNNFNIKKEIISYKPLSDKYEFKLDRFMLYPAKMVQYLQFKTDCESKIIQNKPIEDKLIEDKPIEDKVIKSNFKHEFNIIESYKE
ncbi:MAG: hypothetical protein CMF62_04245 [Magnetococcales bacterium]|nr:hypothetical protein [Magnetococcales bacterium]|tara:strand:+ start:92 stop:1897 length:1806 start_codon:yes stop_codon:yes gene_type:complete